MRLPYRRQSPHGICRARWSRDNRGRGRRSGNSRVSPPVRDYKKAELLLGFFVSGCLYRGVFRALILSIQYRLDWLSS